MTATKPTRLTLKTTQDLVESVPLFLGFHPQDSFVMLAIPGAGREARAFGGRIDLPKTILEISECMTAFVGPALRNDAQRVILYVYDDQHHWPHLLEIAYGAFESAGIQVIDLVHVHHGVGESKDRPHDKATIAEPGQIAAQGIADGHVTETSRESYIARVSSKVDPRLHYPTEPMSSTDAGAYVAWVIDRIGGEDLTVDQVASLATAVQNPDARDQLLGKVTSGRVPNGDHWWASVARNTPTCAETQHLFGLIALGLYFHGTVPLAWALLDRAPVRTHLVDTAHEIISLAVDPASVLGFLNSADPIEGEQ